MSDLLGYVTAHPVWTPVYLAVISLRLVRIKRVSR